MKTKSFKIICFIAIAVFAAAFSHAEQHVGPERLFSRGNDYYEKGEYDKAIEEYENVLATGKSSGNLYYNLGGAYFKNGELGKSILNYERAKYIMPRNGDLNTNLRFAQAMVKGKIMPARSIWSWMPLRAYSKSFTINELTLLSSGMYIVILVLLLLALVWPGGKSYTLTGAILLFVFIVCNTAIIWHKARDVKTGGVTIVPRAEAFFGPFDTATKFFTLNEGDKVNVVKCKGDWCKVVRMDGKVGWIHKDEVEKII
ncbi:tetratricopeptide repeat protein [Candidatus Omnitrophota bacterium]